MSSSPWISRFGRDPSDGEIVHAVRVQPEPIAGLNELSVERAARHLQAHLTGVFFPTAQIVSHLRMLRDTALAYADLAFPSTGKFLESLYTGGAPSGAKQKPICVTGLGGVGKSELLAALAKILPGTDSVEIPGEGIFPLTSLWRFVVEARVGRPGVLTQLLDEPGKVSSIECKLAAFSRAEAFRTGVCLMTADEFQFMTFSEGANIRAAQALLQMSHVGPPLAYCANFSLIRSLMKRPQHEQQRLLANHIVVVPDAADSSDWVKYLKALLCAAPGTFLLDVCVNGRDIHRYTAGIKRLVVELLALAYRHARAEGRPIASMSDVRKAYADARYAGNRDDVEELARIKLNPLNHGSKRGDLICPFPEPALPSNVVVLDPGVQARQREIGDALLLAAATPKEVEAHQQVADHADVVPLKKSAVRPMPRRARTVQDLMAGENAFKQGLEKRP